MSALVVIPQPRIVLQVPGTTPSSGLRNALEAVHAALKLFHTTPGTEALAVALCATAWYRHGPLARMLHPADIGKRHSHRVTVDISTTPMVGIETIIFDIGEDDPSFMHDGTFVLGDVMRDVEAFVRALT